MKFSSKELDMKLIETFFNIAFESVSGEAVMKLTPKDSFGHFIQAYCMFPTVWWLGGLRIIGISEEMDEVKGRIYAYEFEGNINDIQKAIKSISELEKNLYSILKKLSEKI